jgi:hypothetical protein
LATSENAAQRHRIFTIEPILMGTFTRTQLPEAGLCSNLAGASCEVQLWSSHDTSANANKAILNSALLPLMPSVIGKKSLDLPPYSSAVVQLTTTKCIST